MQACQLNQLRVIVWLAAKMSPANRPVHHFLSLLCPDSDDSSNRFFEENVLARIRGIEGMTPMEISFELNRGARFVVYKYCISAAVMTVVDSTDIYFVRAKESRIKKGVLWTMLTLVAGWWGFPWGPIRTVQSVWINLHGGENVTALVANSMQLESVNWADLD